MHLNPEHDIVQMSKFRADVWTMNDNVFFVVYLHAVDQQTAEDYVRSIYPNISDLFVYSPD